MWLHGPVSDLLLGAGLGYLLSIPLLALAYPFYRFPGARAFLICLLLALAGIYFRQLLPVLLVLPAYLFLGRWFEPERYNTTYSGVETELAPIASGPLTIRLTSPRYDLTVLANRLELEPASLVAEIDGDRDRGAGAVNWGSIVYAAGRCYVTKQE